jgi:gas vesicle protein
MDDQRQGHQVRSSTVRQFFLGVLVGIVIGAAGAMIYAELSSSPEEELLEGTAAQER